jgi:hypothetical protein
MNARDQVFAGAEIASGNSAADAEIGSSDDRKKSAKVGSCFIGVSLPTMCRATLGNALRAARRDFEISLIFNSGLSGPSAVDW